MEHPAPGTLYRAVGPTGPLTPWLASPAEARVAAARANFLLENVVLGQRQSLAPTVAEAVFSLMIGRGWRIEAGAQ